MSWSGTPLRPSLRDYTVSPDPRVGAMFSPSSDQSTYFQDAVTAAVGDGVPLQVLPGKHLIPATLKIPYSANGAVIRGPGMSPLLGGIFPGAGFDVTTPLIQFVSSAENQMKDIEVRDLNFDDGGLAFSGTMVDLGNPSGSGTFSSSGSHFNNIRANGPNVTGRILDFDFQYGAELRCIHVVGGPAAPTRTACSLSVNVDTGEVLMYDVQVKATGGTNTSTYLRGNNVALFGGNLGFYVMLDAKSIERSKFGLHHLFSQNNIANLPNIDNISGSAGKGSLSGANQFASLILTAPDINCDGTAHPIGASGGGNGGDDTLIGGFWNNSGVSETIEAAGWTRTTVGRLDLTNLT